MTLALLDRPALPIDDATRRQLLAGGLSLAALLTGCAGSDPAAPARSANDGFPVTIDHKYGSTDIRAKPQRVATVGLVEQDALLALGVVPVATTEWFGEHPGAIHPWAQDELGGATPPDTLSQADGIQFERIAALRPDLILAIYSGVTQGDYDRLSHIAATVAQPVQYVDYGVPWQELTRVTGRAVGSAERAGRLVAELEARFAQVRSEHPEFTGATAIIAGLDERNYYANAPQDARGRFLSDLGFTIPAEIVELAGDNYVAQISPERLDLFDTDVLIWQVATDDQADTIRTDPLYARLDVATQGRDIFLLDLSDLGAASTFQTVLSLPLLLDQLVPKMAAAVDGDPTTTVPS